VAVANRELLASVRAGIDCDEAVELFRREASAVLRAGKRAAGADAARARLAAIEREIDNLVGAIRAGAYSSAVQAALAAAEANKATLQAEIEAQGRIDTIPDMLPRAAERYREMLANLEAALSADVDGSRALLREMLGESIKLTPAPDKQALQAEIPGAGIYRLATRMAGGQLLDNVVAGAGFGHNLTILSLPATGSLKGPAATGL
jgi:hypothetical protein